MTFSEWKENINSVPLSVANLDRMRKSILQEMVLTESTAKFVQLKERWEYLNDIIQRRAIKIFKQHPLVR